MSTAELSPAEALLLQERLPWYLNGTLDKAERAWVDELLARSPVAAQHLQREQALERAVQDMLAPVAQNVGLAALMARVRQANAAAPVRSAAPSLWDRLQQFFARPLLAPALAMAVVAQTGVIALMVAHGERDDDSGMRSVSVTEVRTLRVSFKPSVSEATIREALVRAGARIVGGPTQMGEYWVASDLVSLDEIRASLIKADVTASMEVDLVGPRGQ